MSYLHGLDYNRIKRALQRAGAPTTAEELGISENNLITALIKAKEVRPDRYTILNEIEIDKKKAREILTSVGVI